MNTYRRVVLTGFMGAGKTTVGRALALVLGWRFFDADAVLCSQTQSTIAGLFAARGEAGFRELEAAAVAALLTEDRAVIALGGGAVEHAATRAQLRAAADTLVVFLEAPLAVSIARCEAERGGAVRPVLGERAALENRYRNRLPFYREAHLHLDTSAHTPHALADAIAARVRRGRL